MTATIALVTGANRGLGFQVARRLSAANIQVILTSRREDEGRAATALLEKEGGRVAFCRMDVLEPPSIHSLVEFVRREYGRLDVLINNAGAHSKDDGAGLSVTALTLIEAFTNNCVGALQVTQALVPLLRTSGNSRVINVSTILGSPAQMSQLPGQYFAYRIAKSALNTVTAGLAEELRAYGVSVNAVHPGWLKTDMGGPHAPEAVEVGAQRVVHVALDVPQQVTGRFFVAGIESSW